MDVHDLETPVAEGGALKGIGFLNLKRIPTLSKPDRTSKPESCLKTGGIGSPTLSGWRCSVNKLKVHDWKIQ